MGSRLLILAGCGVAVATAIALLPTPLGQAHFGPVHYDRDVRPILAEHCLTCHGPDAEKRKSALRLDDRADATRPRDDGAAIVPFDPRASAVWKRVSSPDPEVQMPPPSDARHTLSPEQLATLRQWIEEGALYEPHWSFTRVTRPETPASPHGAPSAKPIDSFVRAALDAASMTPSPAADARTLARRLYLDLTGLPPTPAESDAFVHDSAPDARERLVDRLLTEEPYRTRHAQRMAVPWLDLARYADTSGLHTDAGRSNWAWRDWVIEALRANQPYDQFVIEQLAGDLLPSPSREQLIASGFHRNHVTSDEGGAINEEYLLEYAVDRVTTTSAAFLGLSLQCARCHDHKFDPFPMTDFYSMIAFFNSIEEPGVYSQIASPTRSFEPSIDVPSAEQSTAIAALDAEISTLAAQRDETHPEDDSLFVSYCESMAGPQGISWVTTNPIEAGSSGGATMTIEPDRSVAASGANPATDTHTVTLDTDGTGLRVIALEALESPGRNDGRIGRAQNGNAILDSIVVEAISIAAPSRVEQVPLAWAWADVEQSNDDFRATNALVAGDGRVWAPDSHMAPGRRTLLFASAAPFGFEGGTRLRVRLGYDSIYGQHVLGRVRLTAGAASEDFVARLPCASSAWYIAGPWQTMSGEDPYATLRGPETASAFDRSQRFGEYLWRYAPAVMEAEPVGLAQGAGVEFLAREIFAPSARTAELSLGSDDGIVVYLNGARVHEHRIDRAVAPDQERVSLSLNAGANVLVCKVVNTGGLGGFFHRAIPGEGVLARSLIPAALESSMVREEVRAAMRSVWRDEALPRVAALSTAIKAKTAARDKTKGDIAQSMVMKERAAPMATFVHTRGAYDKADPARPVARAVPAVLGTLAADAPRNRLGLAQWLVSRENPLTARVAMNRLWCQFFGRGLVRSEDDFGLRGEWPTHPELLDWLAVEFMESGWDMQHMERLIATSDTYGQESDVRPESLARDPENRLLSYFPRQRLAAEQVRDQALYIAGLLRERTGGPSVKTYQPSGLWEEVSMPQSNTRTHMRGEGDDLWRRSLYTYWKRAVPPPSLLTFDAPSREYCVTRRMTTNTPLQALVLWNDEQFVEAARAAAARVMRLPGDDADRLSQLFQRCVGTIPGVSTMALLAQALQAHRSRYAEGEADASSLIEVGEAPVDPTLDRRELAAWTLVASSILCSDAALVKD